MDHRMRQVSSFAKFAILYTALYSAFGVVSPFLPAFLGDRSLTAEQIAAVIGSATAVRLVSGPLVGRLADRQHLWRGLLAGCIGAAGVVALVYVPAYGFGALLLVSLAQSLLLAPVAPIADALALSASAPESGKGFEYGWVRGAGSAAFIAGSIVAGYAAGSLGLVVSIWLSAILLGVAAITALRVPNIAAPPALVIEQAGSFRTLLAIPSFRRLLLIAGLVLGSHALHDTFAVISWRDAGISTGTASLLWSESVAAEVLVFFIIGPPLVRRLGPAPAAMLAATAGVVRWTVMAASTEIFPLALVEPLHGLTFALLHLASMRVISETVPNRFAATAQAIYGTVGAGVSTTLMTLASGWLYAQFEGQGFLAMAILCAAAIPLARGLAVPVPIGSE
jgi:PPP family 3-phenylpropionic acid transporter